MNWNFMNAIFSWERRSETHSRKAKPTLFLINATILIILIGFIVNINLSIAEEGRLATKAPESETDFFKEHSGTSPGGGHQPPSVVIRHSSGGDSEVPSKETQSFTVSSVEDKINIVKRVTPMINDEEILNDALNPRIDVEIYSKEGHEITFSSITEFVDNGLNVTNSSKYGLILSGTRKAIRQEACLKRNSSDEKSIGTATNNALSFYNIKVPPGTIFSFWYSVKREKKSQSIFSTETMVNTSSSNSSWLTSSNLQLKFQDEPQFRVNREISQSQIFKNDELDIEFDIDYLGGGTEPQITDVNVSLDINEDVYNYTDGNNLSFKATFFTKRSVPIFRTIKFKKEGIRSPPGIWINDRHYLFEEVVTVDKPVWRYFGFLSLIAAAIGYLIILAVKELYLEVGTNRARSYRQIRRILMRTDRLDIFLYIILVIGISLVLSSIIPVMIDIIIRAIISIQFLFLIQL